jgi:MFS family permease
MLSLHASNAQIGLVNTLSQLASATLAIPGAAIADRTGRYKQLSLITGLISRMMWLVMLAAPWLFHDRGAVWTVLIAWVSLAAAGALGNAAWTALSADLVPVSMRGGYFASRNFVMQLVRLLSIPLAGQIVNWIGEPDGYQFNLGLAFVVGTLSLYFYNQIPEHAAPSHTDRGSTRQAFRQIRQLPTFVRFIVAHSIMSLGVSIGGPFISVYMAEEAEFSVGTIGLITTANVFASMVAMRLVGRIHDRLGIVPTMRSGLAIALIPVSWLWVHDPWQGFLVHSLAAVTWAGYNLGAFNLLLAATPDDHRPRYIAIYTTTVAVVAAIGPIIGGSLLDATGFTPVFILSTLVRGLGILLFVILVREPTTVGSASVPRDASG